MMSESLNNSVQEQDILPEQTYSLIRYEHGNYARVSAIGVSKTGKMNIFKGDDFNPKLITPETRIIQLPQVEGALSGPLKVFLDPNLTCPCRCSFCLAGVSSAVEGMGASHLPVLSENQVHTVVDQIINAGTLYVKIGGGEPFIYGPNWNKPQEAVQQAGVIERLAGAGIGVSLSTSGVTLDKLTDQRIDFLARNRVKVSVSIDGDQQYHNALRMPGRNVDLYNRALSGMLRLKEAGVRVALRSTISNTPESMGQIDHLTQLADQYGLEVRIRFVKPSGKGTSNEMALMYPNQEYVKAFNKLRIAVAQNSLIDAGEMVNFDEDQSHLDFAEMGMDCAAGTRSAFINYNGDCGPCGFIDEWFPSLNIFNQQSSLLNMWQNGESFKSVRAYFSALSEKSPCRNCGYVGSCQGGCPAVRLNTGDGMQRDARCPKQIVRSNIILE